MNKTLKQFTCFFLGLSLSLSYGMAQDSLGKKPALSKVPDESADFPKTKMQQYYLTKGSRMNTAAWIFLSLGAAMTVGGIIAYNDAMNSEDWLEGSVNTIGSEVLIGTGIAFTAVSIPLFIVSHNYKKKALQASGTFNFRPYQQLRENGLATSMVPSISFKVNF
jgi:hypothetical protein